MAIAIPIVKNENNNSYSSIESDDVKKKKYSENTIFFHMFTHLFRWHYSPRLGSLSSLTTERVQFLFT